MNELQTVSPGKTVEREPVGLKPECVGGIATCGGLTLNYEARSTCGRVRSNNEDTLILSPSKGLFGVCDGMGGHAAGEIAASIASDTLTQFLTIPCDHPVETLKLGVLEAGQSILSDQANNPARKGMGSTLTAIWVGPKGSTQAWIGHVGDSRVYLYRDGILKQLTEDHSLVYQLYQMGCLTKEQARVHPRRNVVTKSLGREPIVVPDVIPLELQENDRLLICTDGLSDYLSDESIGIFLEAKFLREAIDQLDSAAYEISSDNISLGLLEVTQQNS